jgi:alpha-beta hydrolase superfamily lysophospholipase
VTIVRIDGGLHDLTLSAPPVRAQVFAELDRWIGAYLPD